MNMATPDNLIVPGAVVVGVAALAYILTRPNSLKKLRVIFPGARVEADGFDKPGVATVDNSTSKAGGISAENKVGGDAGVRNSEAEGDIKVQVSGASRPKR